MMELRVITAGQPMPIFALPSIVGRQQAYREIGDWVDTLINFMDDLGGDPDAEPCGAGEDLGTDVAPIAKMGFAGDQPSADENGEDGDEDCCEGHDDNPGFHAQDGEAGDPDDAEWAYGEWQTRGRHKLDAEGMEPRPVHEDAEEDDPHEANGDEQDTGNAEDDELAAAGELARFGVLGPRSGPGCPISDPDYGVEDQRHDGDEGV